MAEQPPDTEDYPDIAAELLKPGSALFAPPAGFSTDSKLLSWWQFSEGANWHEPEGPGTDIGGKERYPVVHVAFEYVRAYAVWKTIGCRQKLSLNMTPASRVFRFG